MRHRLRLPLALLPALALAACDDKQQQARADSLQAVTAEQLQLTTQLSAQKDSLTKVIFEADDFIAQIDSQIRTAKVMPKEKRTRKEMESPIEEQLQLRKETLDRVAALVKRANATAAQLAESRRREQTLRGENEQLQGTLAKVQEQVAADQMMIAQLGETIRKQRGTIDSLGTETRTVAGKLYRAYYVVGTERELLEKGIIEREGGANLLVARPGRTLQPARKLDPSAFTAIDQREVREIMVPDPAKRYRIVSRQSLDNAVVDERDKLTFKGNLKIADTDQFWSPSRYLILVQR